LDAGIIGAGAILYLEGYLFDRDEAKLAFRKAASTASVAMLTVPVNDALSKSGTNDT